MESNNNQEPENEDTENDGEKIKEADTEKNSA
jgi:hypothetical protein